MRLPFFLAFVFALAAATRVPPITKSENWEKFHHEKGCWEDTYLRKYHQYYLDDEKTIIPKHVVILGDFSKPYYSSQDTAYNYAGKYYSEYVTLTQFVNELGAKAFPPSPSAGKGEYANLGVRYFSYNPVDDEEAAATIPTSYSYSDEIRLSDPTVSCTESLTSWIKADYNQVAADSSNVLHTFSYKDADYKTGLETIINDRFTFCPLNSRCYLVVARVNPFSFSQAIQNSINIFKKWGYTVLTLDSADNFNYPESSGLASNPVTRFSHLLPNVTLEPHVSQTSSKLVQAIRGGSSACMTFGEHHVMTFDGVGYDHQQIGDFILAKDVFTNTFEVQVRNELCYEQNNPNNQPDVVCTTGFAMKAGGRTLAVHYDRFADQLAVTVNGTLWKPGYLLFDEFKAYVIRKYPAGYDVAVYVSSPFTYVHATFHYTGAVEVYPAPSLIYGVTGLCGTYDLCAHDEFYTMNDVFTDDVDQFAQSWRVSGGESLFEGPKYNSTNPTPFIMHAPFTNPNWEAYDFSMEEYDDDTIAYLSQLCHRYKDETSFLYHACIDSYIIDWLAAGADTTGDYYYSQIDHYMRDYTFYDLLIREPLAYVCHDMCENGYSRMGGFSHVDINCTGLCDSEMENFNGLRYALPTKTTQGAVIRAPIAESHWGQKAFFYPPMGGEYLIRVKSYDCCTYSPNVEFTIKVNCTRPQLVVFIAPDNDAEATNVVQVNVDEFAFPLINLQASLFDWSAEYDDELHVAWSLLQNPGTNQTEIFNRYSLYPSFIPQTTGIYVFQVVVTDGCSVSSDTVQVNVSCYIRDYVMNTLNSDTMIYEMSEEWKQSYFSTTYLSLKDSCMAPIRATTSNKFTEFPWTYAPVDWTVAITRAYDSSILKVEQVLKPAYKASTDVIESLFKVYWEVTTQAATYTFSTVTNECATTCPKTNFYPVKVPQKSAAAEHEYAVLRAEARHRLTEVITQQYLTKAGSYYTTYWIKSAECWIWNNVAFKQNSDGSFYSELSMWAQNAYRETADTFLANKYLATNEKTSFGWDEIDGHFNDFLRRKTGSTYTYSQYMELLHDNEFFHTGHCPGTYRISVTVKDKYACSSYNDNYLMDISVIRRPMPLPIQPCVDIYFDYYYYMTETSSLPWDGKYPDAYLLGYDSVVPAWRNMDFVWAIVDIWDGSAETLTREDELYLATNYINPRSWVTWFDAPVGNDEFLDLRFSRGSDKEILNDFGTAYMGGRIHEHSYTNGTYNTTGYHYYSGLILSGTTYEKGTADQANFNSVPDVYLAKLYVTDHAMNSMDEVTVVFRCRDHPTPHITNPDTTTSVTLSSLTGASNTNVNLNFYGITPTTADTYNTLFPETAYRHGALPWFFDLHCEFGSSAALTWCRRWSDLWDIPGCCDKAYYFSIPQNYDTTLNQDWLHQIYMTSGTVNINRGYFKFNPRIKDTYAVEAIVGDQCSFGTSWISVTAACSTDRTTFSPNVYDDTTATTYSAVTSKVVPWVYTGAPLYTTNSGRWSSSSYLALHYSSTSSTEANGIFCGMTYVNQSSTNVVWDTTYCQTGYGRDATSQIALASLYPVVATESKWNGYKRPVIVTEYDGCNFGEQTIPVTYTCGSNLPSSAAALTANGVYVGSTQVSTNELYGYNMSQYVLHVHSSNFQAPSTTDTLYGYGVNVKFTYANDFNADRNWDYTGCNGLATWTPSGTTTTGSFDATITVTGCDFDQLNYINVYLYYSDGCTTLTSAPAVFTVKCRYTISYTPRIPSTVTWSDGQFPVVCANVPDADFHWSKPWDYYRGVNGLTYNWLYNVYDTDLDNFNSYDCNFQSCVWYHRWEFTSNTPAESVFQTEVSTNVTLKTYSSRVKASMVAKTCGTSASWSWMINKWDDLDCGVAGSGYYISYDYTVTETTVLYYNEYTWLVSGWDNSWDYTVFTDPYNLQTFSSNNAGAYNDWQLATHPATSIPADYVTGGSYTRDDRENMQLASCFRPDVAGEYSLILHLWDGCWNRDTPVTVTTTAECGAEPSGSVASPTGVIKGKRYTFQPSISDANDNMLVYSWTLTYIGATGVTEDLTDYVTNAHGYNASFIPIYMGMHRYTLTVTDDCNDPVVWTDTFNVTCATSYTLPDPIAPQTSEGEDILYSIYDFTGVGLIPIKDYVTNEVDGKGVTFHWRMIGFDPAYTYYDAYAGERIQEEVVGSAGSVSVSICLLALLCSLFMFF